MKYIGAPKANISRELTEKVAIAARIPGSVCQSSSWPFPSDPHAGAELPHLASRVL